MKVILFSLTLLAVNTLSQGAYACPPGQKPDGLVACGGGSCTEGCEPDTPKLKSPLSTFCNAAELKQNFRWFNDDAPKSSHTAYVRGVIMRNANDGSIDNIRVAYKEGQKQNPNAAALIDDCDDVTVMEIAHEVAEEARLQACGASQPAKSATCHDVIENLRWSLFEAGPCSALSRAYFRGAFGVNYDIVKRADSVRTALKVAQGQHREVFDSIDYIGDSLLLKIATQIYTRYGDAVLEIKGSLSIARNNCPGLRMIEQGD